MRFVVLSTYDIFPVVSGGQSRYWNIYTRLAADHEVTIVAYDYRQTERTRQYQLRPGLNVIAPKALSDDIALLWDSTGRMNRLTHDAQCIRGYRFSPEFHAALRTAVADADAVIASHPFLAFAAFEHCRDGIAKVYEAHNVEFDARAAYYDGTSDRAAADRLLEDVRYGEGLALHEADYVTAVSIADADRFALLYGVPRSKITVVPNGVDVASYPRLDSGQKQDVRRIANLATGTVGVFIGSAYSPNVEAYLRIRRMLAEAGYSGTILLIGAIREAVPDGLDPVPFEERWLGFVDEEIKAVLLGAADFALQLMFSGAGTNLKLFEYMAARTLIAGNAFGTRGVPGEDWYWPVETADDLRRFLSDGPWESPAGEAIVARARVIAEQQFDWQGIVRGFERLLTRRQWEPSPAKAHPDRSPAVSERYRGGGQSDEYVAARYILDGGVHAVEGWLGGGALTAAVAVHAWQREHQIAGNVAEIGIHHGKLFLALKNLCRPDEVAIAIDIFEDQHLNADHSGHGDRQIFERNISLHSDGRNIEIIKCDSKLLKPADILAAGGGEVRLFSIDGSHTAEYTSSDLALAAECLADGGVIIVDDFYNEDWPGVQEGFYRFMAGHGRDFAPLLIGNNKLLICKKLIHGELLHWLKENLRHHFLKYKEVTLCSSTAIAVALSSAEAVFSRDLTFARNLFPLSAGSISPRCALREGWGVPDADGSWTVGDEAVIDLSFAEPLESDDVMLRLNCFPFFHDRRTSRTIDVFLNESFVGGAQLTNPHGEVVTMRVDRALLADQATIRLRPEAPERPCDFIGSNDTRRLSVKLRSIELA